MPRLRAFAVQERDEGTGGIVFARHSIVALREGASQFGDGTIYDFQARRAPWADSWAEEGDVPARVCIEHGWHYACHSCGHIIDYYSLSDKGGKVSSVIGWQRGTVFCNRRCRAKHNKRQALKASAEAAIIAEMRNRVRARLGDVEFITGFGKEHAYCDVAVQNGSIEVHQVFVSFDFEGRKHLPATLRWDNFTWRQNIIGPRAPEYSCSNGDVEAFTAWFNARAKAQID